MDNKKIDVIRVMPYAAVALYMMGLLALVMGKMIPGILCIAVGVIVGAFAAITIWRNKYRPRRRHIPKWLQLLGVKEDQ